ncbi:MAG: dTMP kinase [Chlamydiae bacterium]|nr:dTMP kinase [Chlamydiota bacterium]MBI3276793.1 dTMP kinase [Chlamydiota bacterium]
MKGKKGFLITIEGPEGSGKTTLSKELHRLLKKKGHPVFLTHEPGASSLGKELRKILLHSSQEGKVSPLAELFLFEADRAQHVEEVILPLFNQGKIVLCCRFYDSTTAYQGYGRGFDFKMVQQLNQIAARGLTPDLTLLLDISPRKGLPRVWKARGHQDRIESEKIVFHDRLRRGFLDLAKKNPRRFRVIDASQGFGEVRKEAMGYLETLLKSK